MRSLNKSDTYIQSKMSSNLVKLKESSKFNKIVSDHLVYNISNFNEDSRNIIENNKNIFNKSNLNQIIDLPVVNKNCSDNNCDKSLSVDNTSNENSSVEKSLNKNKSTSNLKINLNKNDKLLILNKIQMSPKRENKKEFSKNFSSILILKLDEKEILFDKMNKIEFDMRPHANSHKKTKSVIENSIDTAVQIENKECPRKLNNTVLNKQFSVTNLNEKFKNSTTNLKKDQRKSLIDMLTNITKKNKLIKRKSSKTNRTFGKNKSTTIIVQIQNCKISNSKQG